MRTRSLVIMSIALVLVLIGAGSLTATEPVPRAYYGARYEPVDKIIHGAGQTYNQGSSQNMAFDTYSALLGPNRYPLTFMEYCGISPGQSWFNSLKARLDGYQTTNGQYVVPQIGVFLPTDSMPPGTYDTELQNFCNGLKSLGRPVFLRVGYEVNGTWYNPMYQPDSFKSAYRRVVEKLRAENVPAAALWCMFPSWSSYYGSWDYMAQFYPGNDVVDWFCCDLFFPGDFTANDTKLFFDNAEQFGKPVIMGESTARGVGADNASDWETWFVPCFDLYHGRKGFKGHTYIDWDWTTTAEWPTWGDCRLETGDPHVRDNYLAEMSRGIWLHTGAAKPYIFPDSALHTVDGIAMAMKSIGGIHDGSGWGLTSNGYVGTFVRVDTPGMLSVTINAEGQGAGGVLPEMRLHVGDQNAVWPVADHGAPHASYADYTANFDLPVGTHCVRIEFTNRSAASSDDRQLFVRSVSFGGTAHTVLNECAEPNVLAASDTYIQNYRRGRATVTLRASNGAALPVGTTVRAKLKRHAFNFGTCISSLVENPTPGSDQDKYQQFIASHFNMVISETAGNWVDTEPQRDSIQMQTVDGILNYCEAHDLRARMDSVQYTIGFAEPSWVQTLETQALTDPVAKQDYRDRISNRIHYYLRDRAGRFAHTDGINESYHQPLNTQIFGIAGIADIYNEMAAVLQDKGIAFVNEFHVVNDPKDTSTSPATYDQYANWYRNHIQSIIDAGGTIGGIGVQDHSYSAYHFPPGDYRALQGLAGFGLPMMVSEFSGDGGSTDPMEDVLADSMRVAFGTDEVQGFVMWGFFKPWMWRNGSALVDENWNLTASGIKYEQLMAQWTTDETTQTDSEGRVSFTGFYGDYEITVDGKTYPLKLEKGFTDYTVYVADSGAPVAPDKLAGTALTSTSIRWSWRDNSSDETGFAVYADQGAAQPTTLRNTTAAEETHWDYSGLAPNTLYSCQVSATKGSAESARSVRLTRRSHAEAPTYGESGPGKIFCSHGPGNPGLFYVPNETIRFAAVNGFGDGAAMAGKYLCIWNTSAAVPTYMQGARNWTQGDLSFALAVEGTCYLHIWSCNADGLVNPNCLTLGPYVARWTCANVKPLAANTSVSLKQKVVSGVFADRIYVQEPDRSSGICVKGSFAVQPGDVVNVTGKIALDSVEAVVGTASVAVTASGPEPKPVYMTNKAAGGSAVGLQPGTIDYITRPVEAGKWGSGLSPIGLLVKTTGQVTYVDPSYAFCYIDDGSKLNDGSGWTGVRISLDNLAVPDVGLAATVTGCLGTTDIGGNCARYLRPRDAGDGHFAGVTDWVLRNPGFEDDVFPPWAMLGTGARLRTGTWASISAHSGSFFVGVYGIKTTMYSGCLRQIVCVPAGNYQASVWSILSHSGSANPEAAKNRIGIDPTGGSDPAAASVVWSDWDTTSGTTTTPWGQLSTPTVTVTGDACTVFLQYVQTDPNATHINCFDDARLIGL